MTRVRVYDDEMSHNMMCAGFLPHPDGSGDFIQASEVHAYRRRQEQPASAPPSKDSSQALVVSDRARLEAKAPKLLEDPKRGFESFGHFAHAIARHGRTGRAEDDRLRIMAAAPTTVGSEGTGADGGFAVPPTFAAQIFVMMFAGDSLLPLCERQETSTNGMLFPQDSDPPWGGAPGVAATWQVEGLGATQIKPALTGTGMRLHKLMAFVPVTDELFNDAPALATYLPKKSADSINWSLNAAILQGNGNGMPAGILGAKCTLLQAKDSGQATATVSVTNASNMLTRLPPGSHGRAVFLANISSLGALLSLGQAASGYGLSFDGDYVPGTKIPMVARLLGRPLIPTAHLSQFSSQGDLVLADLSYYRVLSRTSGLETAWSLHMYFDADVAAFRATFRCDGQSILAAPISPPQGAATLSPFIQLAAR